MRHRIGVLGLVVAGLGCGGDDAPSSDAATIDAARIDATLPSIDAAPFALPEGRWAIQEMRVGAAGCGSSGFDLTIDVARVTGGYEVVHDGSASCSGMRVECTAEKLQLVVDSLGLVTQTTLIEGSCVHSTDINSTPRAVVRRSYSVGSASWSENIELEGTDFPQRATFVF